MSIHENAQVLVSHAKSEPSIDHPVKVAIVIPCFRVEKQIRRVVEEIPHSVSNITCVDDACPNSTPEVLREIAKEDSRVQVIRHSTNLGVGGAVLTGYQVALESNPDVIVKLDGDGQMDPKLIPRLIHPIVEGLCDYTKGNRFFFPEHVTGMPWIRFVGNAGLSFMTKFSTGYWDLFDPTNGFTAIRGDLAKLLPFEKISRRYFFETDMLFHLGLMRASIMDVPIPSKYQDEESNLSVWKALFEFPIKHLSNGLKRLYYSYFLRNFSLASLNLVLGILLMTFGFAFGCWQWRNSQIVGTTASAGTVMLAALPILVGLQLLLNFLNFDMSGVPRVPLFRRLVSADSYQDVGK